jgi:hypothetical protein
MPAHRLRRHVAGCDVPHHPALLHYIAAPGNVEDGVEVLLDGGDEVPADDVAPVVEATATFSGGNECRNTNARS